MGSRKNIILDSSKRGDSQNVIIRPSQELWWRLGFSSTGVRRKSAQAVFFLIFQICLQVFFSFPGRQEKVKENWQRDLGVFPSSGNYLEEPIGFVRWIIVCTLNANDTLLMTSLSAPMSKCLLHRTSLIVESDIINVQYSLLLAEIQKRWA